MKQIFIRYAAVAFVTLVCSCIHGKTELVVIGETNDKNSVYAAEFKFKFDIVNASMGGRYNNMSIVIMKEQNERTPYELSYIMSFNLGNKDIIWSSGLKGRINDTRPTKYGMLVTSGDETRLLDNNDGTMLWTTQLYPVYMDDSLDVLIGYKSDLRKSSKLRAVRISTGEQIWEGKVNRSVSWGWNNIHKTDDDRIIVVADDINLINPATGEIKAVEAKTGYTETGKMAISMLASATSMALGYIAARNIPGKGYDTYYMCYYGGPNGVFMGYAGPGGFFFLNNYGPYVVNGLSSNILEHGSSYYIADRNSLRCFSKDMEQQWQYDYPTKKASASYIIGEDNSIYMLNYGYGLSNGQERRKNSLPFIASINPHTGEQQMFCAIKTKKDIIEDAEYTEDGVLYMFDDGMAYQKNINDSVINITPWDTKKYGKLKSFVRDTLYAVYEETGGFTPIVHEDGFFNVSTDKGYVIKVDKHLNIMNVYPSKNIYNTCFKRGKYVGIYRPSKKKGYDVWIIREQGFPEIHITQNVGAIGCTDDYVYVIDKNTIRYFCLENAI